VAAVEASLVSVGLAVAEWKRARETGAVLT
jgi:hypothetical protein